MKASLSKQAQSIYSLLLAKGPLSATQIATELSIFPQAVYRSTKQLQALGSISQIGKHPAIFQASPTNEAVEAFTLLQRDWFVSSFLQNVQSNPARASELNISFIESREMLFEKTFSDIENLQEEMDNLASGDELPAEIMLAQKNALDRGVTIRTLFQKRNEANESFIQARTKMGERMRISEAINTRIVIFDKRIVYIMSYDPANYVKSIGIRFEYAPIGQLMYQVFQQHWEKGIEV